jgi:prepilin-type N-terminal cleavage/methylation domain-containing protein
MKRVKSNKGMTMVEVVIALAILGLVAVGIMGFFTDSFKFQARSQNLVVAQKDATDLYLFNLGCLVLLSVISEYPLSAFASYMV